MQTNSLGQLGSVRYVKLLTEDLFTIQRFGVLLISENRV
jgi:hypothetical protein